jgi:LPPG:FO 2-phospho-L-lactate transferase
MLAGKLSQERGWGVKGDTFHCLNAMGQFGEPVWLHIGDRDLATHIFRTKLLADGKTLSQATSEIAARLGIKARILPMSDSRVETRVLTPAGDLSFEEYFVQHRRQVPVESVRFAGASDAAPAPGVIDAIRSADLVLLAPSNPVTSIAPILAVPGIREALRATRARIAAVSPIIGGAAVTGPAATLMAAQGFAVSIAGVAGFYRDFLDLLVVDSKDAPAADELRKKDLGKTGIRLHCTPTIMRNNEDRIALAKSVLAAAIESPPASPPLERP